VAGFYTLKFCLYSTSVGLTLPPTQEAAILNECIRLHAQRLPWFGPVENEMPINLTEHHYPLIGPGDPPPFTVINETGPANVLLVGDHASNAFPQAMDQLGLDDWVVGRHVAYDIGTGKLIHHLSRHLGAPAVLAGYSRLIVDLNRSLDDPTAFPEESDGIRIPGNQGLTEQQKAQRVQSFYTPYRLAVSHMLQRLRDRGTVPALIAIHSFTPELAGVARPWHAGLLWDKDPRISMPLLERLRARPEKFNVGDNQPYSGRHPADYTMDHHGEAAGLPHASIEVRQDLVDSEEGAERWATILGEALRPILADSNLYALWQGP
jgi:predicted N-formylglutamate amidohydrolase